MGIYSQKTTHAQKQKSSKGGNYALKIETLKISRVDSVSHIEINGEHLERVLDYKISSSADGEAELDLKIDVSEVFMEFATSASRTEPTSLA